MLTRVPYDLLILDQVMPSGTGTEILKFARSLGLRTPAVLCSGVATFNDQRRAHNLGMVLFLPKPFSMNILVDVVQAALAQDETPVERALCELDRAPTSDQDGRDSVLRVLLHLLADDVTLECCAIAATAAREVTTGAVADVGRHARETLGSLCAVAGPSQLATLLALIDAGNDSTDGLARASGLSEAQVRSTLRTRPKVDIRHWVRLSKVRKTLRLLRQGMKVSSASMDAGFSPEGEVARDFRAVLGLSPQDCQALLR